MSEDQREKQKRAWHYPPQSEHPDKVIYVHEEWCKSCGICYEMCPKGVLSCDASGKPVVENPDACIACYLCEMLCPDMAITVYKEPARKGGTDSKK